MLYYEWQTVMGAKDIVLRQLGWRLLMTPAPPQPAQQQGLLGMEDDVTRKDDQVDDRKLPLNELINIWFGLPEQKRFAFMLHLSDESADELIDATDRAVKAQRGGAQQRQEATQ